MKSNVKSNIKVFLITFIVSGIFFSITGVYAGATLYSDNVIYTKNESESTNVSGALDELYSKVNHGDALSSDILLNKSALVNGKSIIGSMSNNNDWSYVPTEIERIPIPEGYHNGQGYIDTNELYSKLYVEVPLQIMAKQPDFIWSDTVKSGKSVTVDCGFRPTHMTIAYRNTNETINRIGLGFFDFVNSIRYLYWAPSPDYEQTNGDEFERNISDITDSGFTYKNTGTTDHYIIMFIYGEDSKTKENIN